MKLLIPFILLFSFLGFSQPYENKIEDFTLFIKNQKNIVLIKGPYKIPTDTNWYFFVGKMTNQSYLFFYKHKGTTFRLNDTFEFKSDKEFEDILKELNLKGPVKDSVVIIKKENEKAYRDQTIIIYDTENNKTIKQKKVKVPYVEKIDGKWVYLNPASVIWLDQNGNEIKRK